MEAIRQVGCFALIILVVALVIGAAIAESKQWNQYKVTHNCKKAGYSTGSVGTGVAVNPSNGQPGVGIVSIPGKTRYLCDNNEEIWR